VLIVGLGAPKQEIWIERYRTCHARSEALHGRRRDDRLRSRRRRPRAALDDQNGLEWVYRITTEPRRYWRRYLRDTEFFWLVLLDRLGLYRAPAWQPSRPTVPNVPR
jgi:UDP-N-acetyl-D-mannosaminuronic acid transferase (WecB/TagA/CpsF family)